MKRDFIQITGTIDRREKLQKIIDHFKRQGIALSIAAAFDFALNAALEKISANGAERQ